MTFPDAERFLRQTGILSPDFLAHCERLPKPPSGFERIWATFAPMEAMQKRGQIARPRTGEAWQLLCDEGATLGGTDWAPPPLAYFAAGLTSSLAGSLLDRLNAEGNPAGLVSLELDNYYSLSGSILRGTMEGKGLDPHVSVAIDGEGLTNKAKSALILDAISNGLAGYVLKNVFVSEFATVSGAERIQLELPECQQESDPSDLPTASIVSAERPYVRKTRLRPDDPSFRTGTGAGHDPVQNRTIRVSASAHPSGDGVFTVQSGLCRPKASVFDILATSDAGGAGAPSSACLLAAGIGFCFMTQLGRYAEATKRPVDGYRMTQMIDLPLPETGGQAVPVISTSLFLNHEDPDFLRELTHSAKRTCFLHSTLGSALRLKTTVR